jgi:HPt (histidine-containing phosphotransfer) domain-containing protein
MIPVSSLSRESLMGSPVILYGAAIHEAAASGDVKKMKKVAEQAEAHIREHGNVPAALEALRIEIAKAEAGS